MVIKIHRSKKSTDAQKEVAATADRSHELKRLKQLIDVAGDILDVIAARTNGAREAKFVATFVKASIDYWQPSSKS